MKKIILISDLWGGQNPAYIQHFRDQLNKHFDITYYDACQLAGINSTGLEQTKIHQQFVNGGIDTAVKKLLDQQSKSEAIIGFSIGGTIGWKAIQKGLTSQKLYAISATRLRYESIPLDCSVELIFGANDPFLPNDDWFEEMKIKAQLFETQGHEIYKNSKITQQLIQRIFSSHQE